jgi:hypothetical protein
MRDCALQPVLEMDTWVSTAQAARILGVGSSRVRQLALAGRLLYVMTPLGRIYARADVEALAGSKRSAVA